MIRFGKEISRISLPEVKQTGKEVNNDNIGIKYSFEDASAYWDNKFCSVHEKNIAEKYDLNDVTEEQLQRDVYGRSEEEFSFKDFDFDSPDIEESLIWFSFPRWTFLDEQGRRDCVEDFASVVAKELELSNPPNVGFFSGDPCECGYYDPDRNVIMINRENYNHPSEIVDTIAHEMRHAYQFERALKLETYTDLLYAYNFTHYIEPRSVMGFYINFTDYQDQFIEAEARAFASHFCV